MHVPGLRVAMPSNGVRRQGTDQDGNPRTQPGRICGKHQSVFDKSNLPDEEYLIPFGKADIKRAGE